MEIYREIRAFYIKLPYSSKTMTQDVVESLWNLSGELGVNTIDINTNSEILIHSDIEFSLSSWNEAVKYMRAAISLFNVKSGYLLTRKIVALKDLVSTQVEGYKITKRGVYNAELPESPDFIEDVIMLSGRNKKLQQMDAVEKLFRHLEEQDKDTEGGNISQV